MPELVIIRTRVSSPAPEEPLLKSNPTTWPSYPGVPSGKPSRCDRHDTTDRSPSIPRKRYVTVVHPPHQAHGYPSRHEAPARATRDISRIRGERTARAERQSPAASFPAEFPTVADGASTDPVPCCPYASGLPPSVASPRPQAAPDPANSDHRPSDPPRQTQARLVKCSADRVITYAAANTSRNAQEIFAVATSQRSRRQYRRTRRRNRIPMPCESRSRSAADRCQTRRTLRRLIRDWRPAGGGSSDPAHYHSISRGSGERRSSGARNARTG